MPQIMILWHLQKVFHDHMHISTVKLYQKKNPKQFNSLILYETF